MNGKNLRTKSIIKSAVREELAATLKEPVSVYFDTNPHDGLIETKRIFFFRYYFY